MMFRSSPFALSRISITTQLVMWFLALSLIPCVVLTGLISYLSNQSLKGTVRQGLLAISDAKASQLEIYIREHRADLSVASRFPAIVQAVPKLKQIRQKESLDSPAYLEVARTIRPTMVNFVDSFGYSNGYLFDTDGTLLFQLSADLDIGSNLLNGSLKKSELAEVFDRVRTLLQTEMSDYQMYKGRSEPAAFIASPLFNEQGLIIGFVVLELGNQHVFRVFNDYSGLGTTGDTMVVMRNGKELTFVAPPRNEPDAAFKYHIELGDEKATATQKAVQGERGYGEAIDFRGKPIIAAWSYLPSFRWGMVVKQDMDEAFALVYKQRLVVAFLLAATVLAVSAVVSGWRGPSRDRFGKLRVSPTESQPAISPLPAMARHRARPGCCSRPFAR